MKIFGTDYPTPDGTAVRDYIHVADLADAHLRAIERLERRPPSQAINLGTGLGHSVREVIDTVGQVTGRHVPCDVAPRRAGDPPELVADPARARAVLGWTPRYSRPRDHRRPRLEVARDQTLAAGFWRER